MTIEAKDSELRTSKIWAKQLQKHYEILFEATRVYKTQEYRDLDQ